MKTTLITQWNGQQTRKDAHNKEMKLMDAQEDMLVEWLKEKGQRNISVYLSAIAEHASSISGLDISESWVQKFHTQKANEVKVRWATGQEKCRAQALNKPTTHNLFDMVHGLKRKYNIKTRSVYAHRVIFNTNYPGVALCSPRRAGRIKNWGVLGWNTILNQKRAQSWNHRTNIAYSFWTATIPIPPTISALLQRSTVLLLCASHPTLHMLSSQPMLVHLVHCRRPGNWRSPPCLPRVSQSGNTTSWNVMHEPVRRCLAKVQF